MIKRAAKRLRQAQQLHDLVQNQKDIARLPGRPVEAPDVQKGGPAGGRPVLPDQASARAHQVQAMLAEGINPGRGVEHRNEKAPEALDGSQGHAAAGLARVSSAGPNVYVGADGAVRHRVGSGVASRFAPGYAPAQAAPVSGDAMRDELARQLGLQKKRVRRLPGRPVV